MASEVAIVNLALLMLGEPPIQSLDQNCKAAIAMNAVFALGRDIVLADHPWNFAIRRATLAQLTAAPAFGYSYAYQLPTGCLRVLGLVGAEYDVDPTKRYKIEGGQLLTNESEAQIKYIIRVTDAGLFSPRFNSALASWLAWKTGKHITGQTAIAKVMLEEYQKLELPAARSIDAQEDTPEMYESNPWLEARL